MTSSTPPSAASRPAVPACRRKPAKRKRGGLSIAEEGRLKGKLRALACSEAWLDAEFYQRISVDAAGNPVSILIHDPQRSEPSFDPQMGRLRDDGGHCRRIPCRCCGVATPTSGFAASSVKTEAVCPRCGSRWAGQHLSCHRCGQVLGPAAEVTTCLCLDCSVGGVPQEQRARATRDRRMFWRLLRRAVEIRRLQDAYGISPWHTFAEGVRQSGQRVRWST